MHGLSLRFRTRRDDKIARFIVESGKVVELTPKRTEDASACLAEDCGYALHREMSDSKPPKAPILRMKHGIQLVTRPVSVSEGVGARLDVKEISDEVLEVIEQLRELVTTYPLEWQNECRVLADKNV